MADLQGIGNMLAGIGAGFSGNGPQYMYAQQQQQEADALKDERRRQALLRDFVTGYSLLNNGQIDQAKTLFTHRLEMLKQLKAPDMSDTQGIVDRLNSGDPAKIAEVMDGLGSFVQAGYATGDLKPGAGGAEGAKRTDVFKNGAVLQATSDGSIRLTTPSGASLGPADKGWQEAISAATGSGVQFAGDVAAAQQDARYQYAAPIAGAQAQAKANVEAATAPQIAAATTQAQEGAKAGVARDTQARINAKAGDTLALSSRQVLDAFSKVNTGPLMGRVPAAVRDSSAYQTAEAAAGGYRAQMRKIVRPTGSGPWTDVDEQKLDAIVPNLTDTYETVQAKLKQGQELYDAQMGRTQVAPTQQAPVQSTQPPAIKFLGFE